MRSLIRLLSSQIAEGHVPDSRESVDKAESTANIGLGRNGGRIVAAVLLVAAIIISANCDTLVSRHSWSRQWGPMVPHESFPEDCGLCHIPKTWNVVKDEVAFDHTERTGFELVGSHETAACLRCHNDRGPVSLYVERGCGGCHVDIHQGNLGNKCIQCHNEDTWSPTGLIIEHAMTRFPLVGGHAVTPCESCHERSSIGEFRGEPVECEGCHQKDADRAFPNHNINFWVRDCEQCHTTLGWQARGFQHDAFPLEGGHADVDCLQCHVNGQFINTPTDCFFCHQQDYIEAPNHVAENRSTDCTECHNTQAWR